MGKLPVYLLFVKILNMIGGCFDDDNWVDGGFVKESLFFGKLNFFGLKETKIMIRLFDGLGCFKPGIITVLIPGFIYGYEGKGRLFCLLQR